MSDNITTLTSETFQSTIDGEAPVLVDFWAEWCGPCKAVSPILEEIASENPSKISIAKLNIDDFPQPAADHGIMSIPTMVVYQNGVTIKKIVGARSKAAILDELSDILS